MAKPAKVSTLSLNCEDKQKMALKPSKIMSWDFTRELSCRNRQRDSYAKWKANEEAAKQRAKELNRGKM